MANSIAFVVRGEGRFEIRGDLDFASVGPALERSAQLFQGKSDVCIDLSGVERVDSAGLALLVEWLKMAVRGGKKLRLCKMPEQMLAIARASGLDGVLPMQ